MKPIRALVIGASGLIGTTLCRKIREIPGAHVEITYSRTVGMVYKPGTPDESVVNIGAFVEIPHQYLKDVNVAFIVIPSNQPHDAYNYILFLRARGIYVVICEKGALSECFKELHPHLSFIGFNAVVGGGTRVLHSIKDRLYTPFAVKFYMVLNGTLNFIFSRVAAGATLGDAIREAIRLGYPEPGFTDPLEIINAEMGDAVKKATIVYNICLSQGEQYLRADTIKLVPIAGYQKEKLLRNAGEHRFLVAFSKVGTNGDCAEEVIGGFRYTIGGWDIVGGFFETNNPIFKDRLPNGVENTAIFVEGQDGVNGCYSLATGPGAGPDETAACMITDAVKYLRQ